jgi:hypothetical protein
MGSQDLPRSGARPIRARYAAPRSGDAQMPRRDADVKDDLGSELAAELERRLVAAEAMAASLVELERHPGYRLLETITPTGVTAQRWAAAQDRMAGLWTDFSRYQAVLAEARAIRDRRARPGPAEVVELRRLLREPSIELARTVVQRRLTGAVERVETITLEQLAERMEVAYAAVDELVGACDVQHRAVVGGLSPLLERMRAARALAAGLATGPDDRPEGAAIAAAGARLDALAAAATDPLAPAGGAAPTLAGLDADVAALTARLERLMTVRDGWDGRLAAAAAALDELEQLAGQERRVRARASDRIAGHGLVPPADPLPMLRERLDRIAAVPGWPARARRIDDLDAAVSAAGATLRAAVERADGLLQRRAELRGRFEAYRAKAARLGLAELPELWSPARDAERLLWSRPCDLAAATRALNAYRRTLAARQAEGGS